MEIIFRKSFLKALKSLPLKTKELLGKQIEVFKKNQNDSRLHIKILSGQLEDFNSFRLARDYRVIYYLESNKKAIFVDIGHRKDIYE